MPARRGSRKAIQPLRVSRTFITRKLIAGVDGHAAAKLSGRQSTLMIDRRCRRAAADRDFMPRQAMRDVQPAKGG